MATKIKKQAKKKAVDQPKFEITPLPPDTYEKAIAWDTPDGEAPRFSVCKIHGCSDKTNQVPYILCSAHLSIFFERMKKGVALKFAKNGVAANGP